LKEATPFVVNLHGTVADEESWVFTKTDLGKLFGNRPYFKFVQACLLAKTFLFIGITADDAAVNTHLNRLKQQKIDFGTHYWVTTRTDKKTLEWAENAGIRIISYRPNGDDHHALNAFFADLLKFIPKESVAYPVAMTVETDQLPELPAPEQILAEPPEIIRQILNAHAAKILKTRTTVAYERYEAFCKSYDQAIYQAWYTSTEEPRNTLFGHKLIEEIAEGAFGKVYRAESPDGEEVAIKVLKQDVRRKPEMLQSFRRGVHSMSILSMHNIEGMVAYRETSEIPALAVMELVNGPDLFMAVEAGYIKDWSTVLRIAVDLTHIIRSGHLLPERVLHRDIRPSNIMLKNYFSDPDNMEVVVLDFDLSWHLGSVETSVLDTSTLTGFLAPEQVEAIHSASTRNALVDSFGLGMTLFYLRTGKKPQYLQHKHTSWSELLHKSVGTHRCSTWYSLPNRFARLIESSTRDKQSERWDMSQIEGELEQLADAEKEPNLVPSAELWAEELAARVATKRSGQSPGYVWNPDTATASIRFATGIDFHIAGREPNCKVEARISWLSTGDEKHRTVRRYLPSKCERAVAKLKKGGWQFREKPRITQDSAYCCAEIGIFSLQSQADSAAKGLAQAIKELEFK
jgi:serine/threonine protein kinase